MAHNCGNLIPNHWETAFLNCVPSKATILRAFYIFFVVGHQIILTNGFVKKTQKTPPEEIALAQKYRADYFYRKESSS